MHLNNLQKSLLSVDMEEARHRQAKLELIANVQLQFLQLLKAREDMKIVQESKKRIDTQLKAAKAFVAVDMAPYLNVLQNEVEMSNVNQQELRAINAIRNAEVVLNKYLGYAPNDHVAYVGQLHEFNGIVEYTEEEAINTSLYSRPDLIIAQKSVAVAMKQSNITAGNYLPRADLSYDRIHYDKNYDSSGYSVNDYTRSYWNIGLNFSWNVFDGAGTTFSYLGDKKLVASLRKEYEDTMFTARADVIRALLDIQTSKDLISASRKGVDAATESYAMADKRYKTQTGTITELLDAQLRLTQAEADYSQALMEYHGARARFFYNIGKENIGLE
jgi:outer membrane protein